MKSSSGKSDWLKKYRELWESHLAWESQSSQILSLEVEQLVRKSNLPYKHILQFHVITDGLPQESLWIWDVSLFICISHLLYMYEWVPQGFVLTKFLSILPDENYSVVHQIKPLKRDYSCLSRRKDLVTNMRSRKWILTITSMSTVATW